MMNNALRWQLYVSAYTLFLGLPLLLAPNQIIPRLGFNVTHEPWVRLAGMFMLAISYISLVIYRKRMFELVLHSIILRLGFICVLLTLAVTGNPPVFYVLVGIVAVGVVGSTVSYLSETRAAALERPRARP